MDLISREELLKKHRENIGCGMFIPVEILARTIPSVDAVEVVRCKDCIYFDEFCDDKEIIHCICTNNAMYIPKPDGFCSYGVHKYKGKF